MKKYFGTDGIRGPVGQIPITAEWVLKLGWAAGSVFAESGKTRTLPERERSIQRTRVIIGKDTRISGYLLESALQAGLISAGVDILLLGPLPTPAIAFLIRDLQADAGIVISASHNPYQDNGIKFFDAKGYKLSDEIELSIETKWEDNFSTVNSEQLGKAERVRDAEERYIHFCKSQFPESLNLKGLKIILDCANGATYRVAPIIFQSLGAEITVLSNTPDGFNINDHCGSMHTERLAKTVVENRADLGIAFDGDGDRVLMVDNNGEIVDGDELLFIIAKWYVSSKRLKGGIVGTYMSNLGLEEAIQNLGLSFIRTSVGDQYILKKALEKGWNLAGESSGHIICLESNTTGDGIISALQVLAASLSLGKPIAELKKGMTKYPQTLINVPLNSNKASSPVTQEMKEATLQNPEIKNAITETEQRLLGKGRVLVRASGTEPIIRVMVEGQDANLIQDMAQQLASRIKKNNGLMYGF
jgi:phosphoglucosamine mutase